MSDAIARPIMLRPSQIKNIRAGLQTHLTMAASFVPGRRLAVGAEAKELADRATAGVMRIPTAWTKLRGGDMLWVQEETAFLNDKRNPAGSRWFYRADLLGGHVPLPSGSKGARYETGWADASKLTRENSRFVLAIEAVAVLSAQALTWDEVKAEGPFDQHQTLGAWWNARYGVQLGAWDENPTVCGLTFRFVEGNIDTGLRWDAKARDWVAPKAAGQAYP